jgi:hypothetical protein
MMLLSDFIKQLEGSNHKCGYVITIIKTKGTIW